MQFDIIPASSDLVLAALVNYWHAGTPLSVRELAGAITIAERQVNGEVEQQRAWIEQCRAKMSALISVSEHCDNKDCPIVRCAVTREAKRFMLHVLP